MSQMKRSDIIKKRAFRKYDNPNEIEAYSKGYEEGLKACKKAVKRTQENQFVIMLDSQGIYKRVFDATLKDELKAIIK